VDRKKIARKNIIFQMCWSIVIKVWGLEMKQHAKFEDSNNNMPSSRIQVTLDIRF
jgi:hypothetical protein